MLLPPVWPCAATQRGRAEHNASGIPDHHRRKASQSGVPRLEALATIGQERANPPLPGRRFQQQGELDRVTSQAKRMGCDSSGFFSLFSGQSAQCGPVNNQIQQMRGILDQITTSLERLRGGGFGGAERENQRRSGLTALAQNNCGPQYANAARSSGNFLDNLFGNNSHSNAPGADFGPQSEPSGRSVSAPATAPISGLIRHRPARFPDENRCKALPGGGSHLFAYRNPGEDINQAVSINGQPYSALPNAFKFGPSSTVLRLQAGRPGPTCSSTTRRRRTGRHHRHRKREEDGGRRHKPAPPEGRATGTRAGSPETGACSHSAGRPNEPIRSVGPTFIPAK